MRNNSCYFLLNALSSVGIYENSAYNLDNGSTSTDLIILVICFLQIDDNKGLSRQSCIFLMTYSGSNVLKSLRTHFLSSSMSSDKFRHVRTTTMSSSVYRFIRYPVGSDGFFFGNFIILSFIYTRNKLARYCPHFTCDC